MEYRRGHVVSLTDESGWWVIVDILRTARGPQYILQPLGDDTSIKMRSYFISLIVDDNALIALRDAVGNSPAMGWEPDNYGVLDQLNSIVRWMFDDNATQEA